MERRTKEINGEVFTVIVPKEKVTRERILFSAHSLDYCYERPSDAKRQIYTKWMKWFFDVEGLSQFGIESYNCMMFTLTGLYYDNKEDKYYRLYISKTRQELTELA